MTKELKGVEWVLEQLENISKAMIPTTTCDVCKTCKESDFSNCIKGMGLAISELASMSARMIQHINILYDVLGNMVGDPEKLEELKKNGYEGLYS